MEAKANNTTNGLLFKSGDGLRLCGLIVSADIVDKNWEGVSYRQLQVTISSGKKTYLFRASDKRGPLPDVEVGRRASIDAESVSQDKGVTTVYGEFAYEN